MHSAEMSVGHSNVSKGHPYVPIKDVDFTSAKSKRRTDNIINLSDSAPVPSSSSSSVAVRPPDENELNAFFKKLGDCKSTKPAVLSLIPEYACRYIPKS